MSGPETCMLKVIGSCRGKFTIVHCNMICFLKMPKHKLQNKLESNRQYSIGKNKNLK